ncbi:hypothetical protein BD770DRAFT_462629 [Pilaira anomala]|nr:hypothetical protein BD770DRAFT_462629 [Pilaira anomala]
MSKPSKDSPVIGRTIWKGFPHRIKGLLKRGNSGSGLPLSQSYTTTHQKKTLKEENPFIELKNKQWKTNGDIQVQSELDLSTEVPLRANLMSFFQANTQQQQQQQEGWSKLLNKTTTQSVDDVSRVYIGTLGKIRLLNHYTMEQQIAVHRLLSRIQNKSHLQQQQHYHRKIRPGNNVYQRDFNSILSIMNNESNILNNRKPRRTRYIFMLLGTPVSHVTHKVHPVTEALLKARKPYAETITVITSEMILEQQAKEEEELLLLKEKESSNNNNNVVAAYKFVPADYLLDPTTLRGNKRSSSEPQNRLGTKFSGSTKEAHHHQQQQQQQDVSSIAPFMAKIQIQTS